MGQICGSVASGAPAYRDLQQSGDFSNPAMVNFNIPNSKSISTHGNIQQHISTAPAQRQGIHSNMLQHSNSEQPVSITTVVPSHATSGHHINPGTFPTRFSQHQSQQSSSITIPYQPFSFQQSWLPMQQSVLSSATAASTFSPPGLPNIQLRPAQFQSFPTASQSQAWHAGMSPFKYYIILLPTNVSKCYGCNQKFAEKYRNEPHNLVIRHRDRRITGKDDQGNIAYCPDYTSATYHLNIDHVQRKNPTFDGNVLIEKTLQRNLTPGQRNILNNSKFTATVE